jgi:hypothetical protein
LTKFPIHHSCNQYADGSCQQGQQETYGCLHLFGFYHAGEHPLKNCQGNNEDDQRHQEGKNDLDYDRRAFNIPQLLVHLLAIVPLVALLTEFLLSHSLHYQIEQKQFIIDAVEIGKQNFLKLRGLLCLEN